ncbi:hypothetical protein AVEN_114637-1 [Araneus ventricosus]|uniref:DUF4817 domain-containing protein n=1 Tax=Araneus ventricosus TaxID=182803 RepID=A0A4Y2SR93_ARAVE|nr:hypothetical protein AVEN_114637-1 [Araneus ventricosus]
MLPCVDEDMAIMHKNSEIDPEESDKNLQRAICTAYRCWQDDYGCYHVFMKIWPSCTRILKLIQKKVMKTGNEQVVLHVGIEMVQNLQYVTQDKNYTCEKLCARVRGESFLKLKMSKYSVSERISIVEAYYSSNNSPMASQRKFATQYKLKTTSPSVLTIKNVIEKFEITGSVDVSTLQRFLQNLALRLRHVIAIDGNI